VWLVTGIAGFIGSNLLEDLLALGQTVVGAHPLDLWECSLHRVRMPQQQRVPRPNDLDAAIDALHQSPASAKRGFT